MCRYPFVFMVCFSFVSSVVGQWEVLNQGVSSSFHDMDFVTEQTGWIVGDNGMVLKTENGGASWFELPAVEDWHLRRIDFINESVGWALGMTYAWGVEKEAILRSEDSGLTWQVMREIPDRVNNWVVSMHILDEATVSIVVTHNYVSALILKTSDRGAHWEDITPPFENRNYYSVWFFDQDRGIASGACHRTIGEYTYDDALIMKTNDGGHTWQETKQPAFATISDLHFINDSIGFFISGDGLLFKTKDAFNTWPETALFDSARIYSYHVLEASTIYAVEMSNYWLVHCDLLKSMDGGRSFERKFYINWNVDNICFANPDVGFIFGGAPYGGTIFRTADGGEHWQNQLLSYNFRDVVFLDEMNGIACGGLYETHFTNGNIFKTDDGGKTWNVTVCTGEVRKVQFINYQVGFASSTTAGIRSFPAMYKTQDGGRNWEKLDSLYWDEAFFLNEKKGWAIAGGAIIQTNDGGDSWEVVWNYPNPNDMCNLFNSIIFIDSLMGWAVGDCGLIAKCEDGQQWQQRPSITTLPLNRIYFTDKHNGFITGGYLNWEGYQAVNFRTTDGGENWHEISDLNYLIHDIYFYDTKHGWAVGADKYSHGVIVETSDGGEHWFVQREQLIGPLHALSYIDHNLWAVGNYGQVLRITVNSTTFIEGQQDDAIPQSYELMQNYPNPFNSTTAISYQLSTVSQVELSIYNLLGQKVATLVSGKQPAGYYRIEWGASDFVTGVYLYRLEAGEFSETRKLLLIK